MSSFVVGYNLSSVSLVTMTSISVDRLIAQLFGMKYELVFNLKAHSCSLVRMRS